MNLTPAPNCIAVKQADADEKSPGGILLPDQSKEKPREGVVVAVGDNIKLAREGVKVWYSWGTPLEIDGEDIVIVQAENILAYN